MAKSETLCYVTVDQTFPPMPDFDLDFEQLLESQKQAVEMIKQTAKTTMYAIKQF